MLSKAKIAESNTFYSFFCFFYTMWLATYIIIRVVSARTLLHSKKKSHLSDDASCFFVPFLLQSFLKKVYHAVPNKYMTLYPKAFKPLYPNEIVLHSVIFEMSHIHMNILQLNCIRFKIRRKWSKIQSSLI